MRSFLISLFVIFTIGINAQEQEVIAKLAILDIPIKRLSQFLNPELENVSYDLKQQIFSESDGGAPIVYTTKAKFDATQPQGKKWTLISYDGVMKNMFEKNFEKTYNSKKAPKAYGEIDITKLKMVTDNDSLLKFEYGFIKKSLPDGSEYLNDCTGIVAINKLTRTIESIHFYNFRPTKYLISKTNQLDLWITFENLPVSNYQFLKEVRINFDSKMLGTQLYQTDVKYYSK